MRLNALQRWNQLILLGIISIFTLFSSGSLKAQLRINEIVASNYQSFLDEDGDSPGWIELFNDGNSSIDLKNYSLSDNVDFLDKWRFDSGVINPGEYIVVFTSEKDRPSTSRYWETVIHDGTTTKYIVPYEEFPANWKHSSYDDSDWPTGRFGIGYGDNDDETLVPEGSMSVYTRTFFDVADPTKVSNIQLNIDFDDGYILFLNGQEVHRQNIEGEVPISYLTPATTFTEPRLIFGQELESFDLSEYVSLLMPGQNLLSIQVHNHSSESSDITLIPFLSLAYNSEPDRERYLAPEANLPESVSAVGHTNFRLSASGETVLLSNPLNSVLDSVTYPLLLSDESYGRRADDGKWKLFRDASPNAENDQEHFSERLSEPKISLSGGFYSGSVEISLAQNETTEDVYFTLDGSEPNINSEVFGSGKMTISETRNIRFRRIRQNQLSSKIVTQTYFIGERTELPVISISANPDDLWSDERGIYVDGTNGIAGFCRDDPVNWNQDWEIPVHIEFYEDDKHIGFSVGAGAKIFGGCSRTNPQKSLAFYFRGRYGLAELEYPLFKEKDKTVFQSFVIRNSGNDFNRTQLRDGMMTNMASGLDLEYQAFRPAVVFINGEYWGIQNIREKVSEHFVASETGAFPQNLDMLEFDGGAINGTNENYERLLNFLTYNDPIVDAVYDTVLSYIDIDNFIDYYLFQIYLANLDWPGNNIKYYRDRVLDTKWRWILYDTDFGFSLFGNNLYHNTLAFALDSNGPGWPNPPWSTFLFRKVMRNERFKADFVNRFADLMQSHFLSSRVESTVDSLAAIIQQEMPRHFLRWGGSFGAWSNEINGLKQFGRTRPAVMEGFVRTYFSLGNRRSLSVDVMDTSMGIVMVNRLIPKSFPFNGRYYEKFSVPITAKPKPGFEFDRWSGDIESEEISINIETGQNVTAHFRPISSFSGIVINEIMYNDFDSIPTGDWIELYNSSEQDIALDRWKMSSSSENQTFTFPRGISIKKGEYLVLSSNRIAFERAYRFEPFAAELPFNLDATRDKLTLINEYGHLVDEIEYLDVNPWPEAADGEGHTLVLKDATLDNSLSSSWKASPALGGNPTYSNSTLLDFGTDLNPGNVQLHQNYPNPFNSSTNIEFVLSHRSLVRIDVYDMMGRQIYSLGDNVYDAGLSTVTLQSENLASGVYIYRLIAGRFSEVRRFTIIK